MSAAMANGIGEAEQAPEVSPQALRRCRLSADIVGDPRPENLRIRLRAWPGRGTALTAAHVVFDRGVTPAALPALAANIRDYIAAGDCALAEARLQAAPRSSAVPMPADRTSTLLFLGCCCACFLGGALVPLLLQVVR